MDDAVKDVAKSSTFRSNGSCTPCADAASAPWLAPCPAPPRLLPPRRRITEAAGCGDRTHPCTQSPPRDPIVASPPITVNSKQTSNFGGFWTCDNSKCIFEGQTKKEKNKIGARRVDPSALLLVFHHTDTHIENLYMFLMG